MLEVAPGRRRDPRVVSVCVSTAKTLLLTESKAIRMFRVGEIAIRPGAVPALKGETRAMVSLLPFTNIKAPNRLVELTSWETSTRLVRWLGGPLPYDDDPYPQESKFSPAPSAAANTRMRFFKRQAP